jgi:hypothetical protein
VVVALPVKPHTVLVKCENIYLKYYSYNIEVFLKKQVSTAQMLDLRIDGPNMAKTMTSSYSDCISSQCPMF